MVPPAGTPAFKGENASMSRVSVAERAKLSVFLARGLALGVFGRLTALSASLPFIPGKSDRLIIAPQELRTSDSTRASEIYSGRFVFAGKVVVCDAHSPFEVTPPPEEGAVGLPGFSCPRHPRAPARGIPRPNARALVDEWINRGAGASIAGRPDAAARRII